MFSTLSYHPLHRPPPPLPPNTTRQFLPSSSGPLELLSSLPTHPSNNINTPPLLLLHGGFGSAIDYYNYLPQLSSRGYPTYAISLRGHGQSHRPSYLSLYFTRRHAFISDVLVAVKYVSQEHRVDPILVGHSAGGGIAQELAASSGTSLSGLVLIAAIPGYGGLRVNRNWLGMDWLLFPRLLRHMCHPRSPLSSTALVRRAFYSPEAGREVVEGYERRLAEYESVLWPLSMLRRFVDREELLGGIEGWGKRKVLVVWGEKDILVRGEGERLVKWIRGGREGGEEVMGKGVNGVGHMVMLDSNWKEGVEVVAEWLDGR
jgi:pimeloyl-ACP methyl ester carboxylesterase